MTLWRTRSLARQSSPFRRSQSKATPMARRIHLPARTRANFRVDTSIGLLRAALDTICRKRRRRRSLRPLSTSPKSESDRQGVDRWSTKMSKYSAYEYRTQTGFDMNTFEGAYQAIPMKTLVIHCFDPRAAEIPQAVAAYFGDEVYPGENILDKNGNRVGSTRTLFVETN